MSGGSDLTRVPAGKEAVMLNANAGRVRKRHAELVRRHLPDALLLWTRSLEEANDGVEALLESGIETVFAGGGDGTIIDIANRLLRYRDTPRLGVLRLGTGNALATWVGARGVAEDLKAWAQGQPYEELPMRLVEADGERFPFAGLGWDAAALNDYKQLKERMEATALKGLSQQLWVWLAAIFGRTVPRMAVERVAPRATIRVRRGEAWRVDLGGERIGEPVPEGGILYDGPAHLCAFATTPYYGYAIRMFPHAERSPGHLHVRVSAMDVGTVVNEIHRLWTGELVHERLYDFLAEEVEVRFEQPVPYQVGGDGRGVRDRITVRISPLAMPVLRFIRPPGSILPG
jgi:diacylglycerol kinase family enzyme